MHIVDSLMTSVIVAEVFAQLGRTRKGRTTPVLGETSAWGTAFQSIGADFSFSELNNSNIRSGSRHNSSLETGSKSEKFNSGGNKFVGSTKTIVKKTSESESDCMANSDISVSHDLEVKESISADASKCNIYK